VNIEHIIEKIKNSYLLMEDKWYGILDKIDKHIPIYPVIDKIDSVVPSFALFLTTIFIILLLITLTLLTTITTQPLIEATIIVTSEGLPVEGAEVILSGMCLEGVSDEDEIEENFVTNFTNSSGKVIIELCETKNKEYTVNVSKQTFDSLTKKINLDQEHTARITLTPTTQLVREIYASIKNQDEETITNATLEMICVNDSRTQEIQPQNEDYIFTIFECQTIQLKATAQGYETKTQTLDQKKERVEIILEKSQNTGNVIFEVKTTGVANQGAEITLIDEIGKTNTRFTDNEGIATFENITSQTYNYNVIDSETGNSKHDSFELKPRENKTIEINFTQQTQTQTDSKKKIKIIVVDEEENPIPFTDVIIFRDGNYYTTKQTTIQGIVDVIAPDENLEYVLSINKIGYVLTMVNAELKTNTETHQKIILKQGGATIIVNIIDEEEKPVTNASVEVYLSGFNGYLAQKTTDINGESKIENLPPGNYTIKAMKTDSKGQTTTTLIGEEDKQITIKMMIGNGKIRFNTKDQEGRSINVKNYSIETKRQNQQYILTNDGDTSNYYYETDVEKHGTKIITKINDSNYFPYESIEYTIYKSNTPQRKDIYMIAKNNLPNNKKTQMFLQEIYTTNPIQQANATTAKRLEAGKRYYLQFAVVLNTQETETNSLLTNIFVGPKDLNELQSDNPLKIQGAISTKNSISLMSQAHNTFEINYLNENVLVNENAKQINIRHEETTGPKIIPIILTIDVDENADGQITNIYYQAKWGNETSLEYFKEFEIGKTLCTTNCPTFLFNNKIKWNTAGENYKTISDEDIQTLYIEDEYTLKTTVQNLTDEDFEQLEIYTTQNSTIDRVLFDGNSTTTKQLTLGPLTESQPIETQIEAISSISLLKIRENLMKYVGATDLLDKYPGKQNEIRVKVSTKDRVKIEINPTIIYAGSKYPMFVIKMTNDTLKQPLQGNWRIEKQGENGLFNNMFGQTDENGLAIVQLDAMNLSENDKLIFIGNSSGMIEGKLEKTIKSRTPTPEPEIIECLTTTTEILNLSVGATGTFVINSACEEERMVFIHTDQQTTPKQFQIQPGENKTITITGTARNNILGAYPLQVLSINGSRYTQIAFIDIVITDPNSCFQLSQAIYDFTNQTEINSTITNNCFSGRKDIYYPQANISTNSVALAYTKNGVPAKITLHPVVIGSAIESIIYGQIKADAIKVSEKNGKDSDPKDTKVRPTTILFAEEVARACEDAMYDGQSVPKPNPEYNYDREIPIVPVYDPSEVVGEDGTTGTIIQEEIIETSKQDETTKAEFRIAGGGLSIPTSKDLKTGDWGVIPLGSAPEEFLKSCVGGKLCGDEPENLYINEISCEIVSGCTLEGENTRYGCCIPGLARGPYHQEGYKLQYYFHLWNDLYGGPGMGVPRPPEWGVNVVDQSEGLGDSWTTDRPQWIGGGEEHEIHFQVTDTERCSRGDCRINQLNYLGDGELFGEFEVKGYQVNAIGTVWTTKSKEARFTTQVEMGRIVTFLKEQRKKWEGEVTITPNEGVIFNLGFYEATPETKWMNEETGHGYQPGDAWYVGGGYSLYQLECVAPQGFVDPERHGYGEDYKWEIRDPNNPHVEYDPSGNIMYWIPEDTIPQGIEMWLDNGRVYAKYHGTPQENSKEIELTITKRNVLGTEYAIITIKDWTGNDIEEQAFQIKIEGPEHNCYNTDGTEGFTGREFSPRLLFDWDWANIQRNQCDYENPNYTYCDATQFTVQLFKKIKQIDDLLKAGRKDQIGTITSFHSYLIKDNYSQQFLRDFKQHYTNEPFNVDPAFITAGASTGYDTLITNNKITFEGGQLQYGGLHQVSLEITFENEAITSLIHQGQPNANIKIKFIPYQRAPNYNPFYETPFNGKIGINGRNNYGTSVTGNELKLNPNTTVETITGALKNITHTTTTNLQTLNTGNILTYNTNTLEFNPAQPTPIIMKIESTTPGRTTATYTTTGTGATNAPNKNWQLIGSTIGGTTCKDFEDQSKANYTDTGTGPTKTISWQGNKTGTLELAATYFTPKTNDNTLNPNPPSTTLKSKQSLMSADTVLLNNYFSQGINDYDTLEGLFKLLDQQKVCMSQNSEEQLIIWWNPEYLKQEIVKINTETPSCS
jgi:hypothetical protein